MTSLSLIPQSHLSAPLYIIKKYCYRPLKPLYILKQSLYNFDVVTQNNIRNTYVFIFWSTPFNHNWLDGNQIFVHHNSLLQKSMYDRRFKSKYILRKDYL